LQEKYRFNRPFLKMDTQGHNIAVARGADPYLKNFIGLQRELALTTLYKDQPNFNDALELIGMPDSNSPLLSRIMKDIFLI